MVRNHATTFRQPSIVRDDRTAVSICTKILARIETERSYRSNRANAFSIYLGPVGLGAIFDDAKVVLHCELDELHHVTWTAVQVNGHYR